MSFNNILGIGRGNRPAVASSKVSHLIDKLRAGGEPIVIENMLRRSTLSEINRSRLEEALSQHRLLAQQDLINRSLLMLGLNPRVDSQGLASGHQMHRWPGHWHSEESLLMASPQLKSQTNCGIKFQGGDSNWSPLAVGQWNRRPKARCNECDQGNIEIKQIDLDQIRPALVHKRLVEAEDLIRLRQDPWPVVARRVLHPLDWEEINTLDPEYQAIAYAWEQLATSVLAQRPGSHQAVADLALSLLSSWLRELR